MRLLGGFATAVAAVALAGCPNPNAIGVQTYGTVAVKTVDANTGQPVAGALVNAGSTYTCSSDSTGNCLPILNLPVGKWSLVASAPGLHGGADVTVVENQQVSVTIQLSP